MTAEEAYAAWDAREDPPSPGASPEVFFARYTVFGRGHMLDNGHVSHDIDRVPVWAVRFRDVPAAQRSGPPAPPPGATASKVPPVSMLVDYVSVISDDSGESLGQIQSRPDDPPAPMRSWDEPVRGKPCPADFHEYGAPGLVDDGGTALPIMNGMTETMPRAVVRGSNHDVYQVWGGAGSVEHATSGDPQDAADGIVVVVRHGPDPCAHPRADEALIVFHHEPSATGVVTLTAIDGDLVRYRTKGGTTATYNVVTAEFG